MYPYDLIFGLGLYELLTAGGILCAMVIFRHLSEQRGLCVRLHNFFLADAVITVVGGYFSAVLAQAFYDFLAGRPFALTVSTGATFLGGFVGGTVIFLTVYFLAGHFLFPDKTHLSSFPAVTDIIAVMVPAAHAFGRLGCLMAGCCHGRVCDWGVYHELLGVRVVPVQLFEAVFLGILAVFVSCLTKKKTGVGFAFYLLLYGVWRFLVEFFRDDDRGASLIDFLSPSQFTAVLLVLAGAAILIARMYRNRRNSHAS